MSFKFKYYAKKTPPDEVFEACRRELAAMDTHIRLDAVSRGIKVSVWGPVRGTPGETLSALALVLQKIGVVDE